jgi:uncharacterized membrane protein YphA (DoxX/SURF4 family)
MSKPFSYPSSIDLGLLLARVPVGVTLAYAGFTKIAYVGVSNFASTYQSSVPWYMPPWFGHFYLHAVPFVEVACGLLMILGLTSRLSAFFAAAMLISFGLIRSGVSGFVDLHPTVASALIQAPAVYAMFAMVVLFAGPGQYSLDGVIARKIGNRPAKMDQGFGH